MPDARVGREPAAQHPNWGRVPEPFVALVLAFTEDVRAAEDKLGSIPWPSDVGDAEPRLVTALEATERVQAASRDLRSALSAYAHKIHQPRPRVGAIAEAQNTSTQGLIRRYTDQVEDSVRALIDGEATVEDLTSAFTSLTPERARSIIDVSLGAPTGIEVGPLVFPGTPAAARSFSSDERL